MRIQGVEVFSDAARGSHLGMIGSGGQAGQRHAEGEPGRDLGADDLPVVDGDLHWLFVDLARFLLGQNRQEDNFDAQI